MAAKIPVLAAAVLHRDARRRGQSQHRRDRRALRPHHGPDRQRSTVDRQTPFRARVPGQHPPVRRVRRPRGLRRHDLGDRRPAVRPRPGVPGAEPGRPRPPRRRRHPGRPATRHRAARHPRRRRSSATRVPRKRPATKDVRSSPGSASRTAGARRRRTRATPTSRCRAVSGACRATWAAAPVAGRG